MKIYLVGGAVRDQLLGYPSKEKDWVVVGATQKEMLQQGFQQVGKDFPVFLHPKTKEEYALARTERKVGKGYTGFAFDASEAISLEEDLKRRDLTINAMAMTEDGVLIDPFHGKDDLEKKYLRHVSEAFSEDPVRLLRVARFAARYQHLGFQVAAKTNELMRDMVKAGEVLALVPERVWKELERALGEAHPEQFFVVLDECDALESLFPKGLDVIALKKAATLTKDSLIRFGVLLHALKAADILAFAKRYKIPADFREFALLVANEAATSFSNAKEAVLLLQKLDAFRREARFHQFLMAKEILTDVKTAATLLAVFTACKKIDLKNMPKELKGHDIAEYILEERVKLVIKQLDIR